MLGAIYARVSTPGQREEGTSLETQVEQCLAFAKDKDLEIPPEFIFKEQGSGADRNRPVLAEVRQLARDRRVQTVIIYHPDRLSRDATDLMLLHEEIVEHDVELHFIEGPVGNSPEDKLLRFVFGYKSEAERRDTKERTMRGKRKTAENGKMPNGTGRGLYGYKQGWEIDDESGKPKQAARQIVEEQAAVVREIFDEFIRGKSYYEIAVRLNERGIPTKTGSKWHPLTIKRMLTNSAYMGITYFGKERVEKIKNSTKRKRTLRPKEEWVKVEGFTPAIVSEQTFEIAQVRVAEPKLRKGRANEPYLLRGHAICGECGGPMVGSTLRGRWRYYRCSKNTPTTVSPQICKSRYVRSEKLESAIWSIVERVLRQPTVVLAEMRQVREDQQSPLDEEIARLRVEIKRCADQETRLVQLFQYGEIDDDVVRSQVAPLKLMREQYQDGMRKLEAQKASIKELEAMEDQVQAYCEKLQAGLDNFGFEDKRLALRALQIKATYTESEGRVEVRGVLGTAGASMIDNYVGGSRPSNIEENNESVITIARTLA